MQHPSPEEVTAELRRKALTEYPLALRQDPAYRESPALGVLMETGYEKAEASLVALIDGSASIYFSSVGGILGGAGHAAARIAALRFTQAAAPQAGSGRPA